MRARRAHLQDVFRRGEESVVMAGANVVRLSELATFLLGQISDWRTSDQLAIALVDYTGGMAQGTLMRGDNPVLMTLELVLEAQ